MARPRLVFFYDQANPRLSGENIPLCEHIDDINHRWGWWTAVLFSFIARTIYVGVNAYMLGSWWSDASGAPVANSSLAIAVCRCLAGGSGLGILCDTGERREHAELVANLTGVGVIIHGDDLA